MLLVNFMMLGPKTCPDPCNKNILLVNYRKTGIPGIIFGKPNSSTLHIFEHVLHSKITNVSSSTKSLTSWSSISLTFHLRRLLTGPLKTTYKFYEYFSNYSKVQIKCRNLFQELFIDINYCSINTCIVCMTWWFPT